MVFKSRRIPIIRASRSMESINWEHCQKCSTGPWESKWISELHSEGHQMSQEKRLDLFTMIPASYSTFNKIYHCYAQTFDIPYCPWITLPSYITICQMKKPNSRPNYQSSEIYLIPQTIYGRRLSIMVARIPSTSILNVAGRGGLRTGGVSGR